MGQEQLSGLEFRAAGGFDVFFDQHAGRTGTWAAGMGGADAHFHEVPQSCKHLSLSPYLCLILSALLLSVHFPFSCLVPHLCLCLLLNLVISLFFCVLVSSPFCDTIFVLGCAIYIYIF